MRTLGSALLAAQKSASALPYLRVQILDRLGGVRRLRWERLYTGTEPDGYHAVAMPGDGSLIRARVEAGQLYYQRVASPGPGSSFGAWTALGAAANAGVALASDEVGASVLLFYVGSDGVTIYRRESSDYGATLGAAVATATATAAVGWLAAALKADGTALLLYSAGATVYAVKRSGGVWGAPAAWSNSVAAVTGLACLHWGDFDVAVAGSDAQGKAKVWTAIYGDGFSQATGTWSPLMELTTASAGSGVEFRAPFLVYPDVFRLSFVEKYTGSQSYARPYFTYAPATAGYVNNLWREPFPPLDLSSEYGLALAYGAARVWLSAPGGVWRAGLEPPALDATADVLELVAEDRPGGGRLRLALRNDDGRYLDLSTGANAAIRPGGEVRVSPGYATSVGTQASDGPAYWLEGWEYTSGRGEAALVLHASDGWSLLEGWRARRQYAWAKGQRNVFQILAFVCARAGLEFASLGHSTTVADFYPAFTIHPGEDGAAVVRRLLAMVPDLLFFRGHFAYIKNPLASEASAYAYGSGHAIFQGRYGTRGLAANRVQVFGAGLLVEGYDWGSLGDLYDRLRQLHDLNLDTTASAQERATAELRRETIASASGEIAVPTNCGQELYDVVTISDAAAGLATARRRVVGLTLRYAVGGRAVYQQRLLLGAP